MAHIGERLELERAFSGATVHDMPGSKIFDVCILGMETEGTPTSLGKKDMEGFPSLPNCLLRFGFLSRIFWGSNTISPGVWKLRLYFYCFFVSFFFPSGFNKRVGCFLLA